MPVAEIELVRKMPMQKPHRSKQDYATPREFLDAVEAAFGTLVWDLAATYETAVVPCHYYGPDNEHPGAQDSLAADWRAPALDGLLWLNPPFGRIAPWAEKCAHESQQGAEILFLVPASVGANWFWDHVAPYAKVYVLSPRLSFDGKHPFPKDLVLAHYGADRFHCAGFERWRWKEPSQ